MDRVAVADVVVVEDDPALIEVPAAVMPDHSRQLDMLWAGLALLSTIAFMIVFVAYLLVP